MKLINSLLLLGILSACGDDRVEIDVSTMKEGCSTASDCIVVSTNACDVCQLQRDTAISEASGDQYSAEAEARHAECGWSPPSFSPCGSSRASVAAECVESRCIEVVLETD